MTGQRIKGGEYYRVGPGMWARETQPDEEPEVVACRRVADCQPGFIERLRASIGWCVACGQPVAFDPNGPHPDVPKVCMQCVGVTPDPIVEDRT